MIPSGDGCVVYEVLNQGVTSQSAGLSLNHDVFPMQQSCLWMWKAAGDSPNPNALDTCVGGFSRVPGPWLSPGQAWLWLLWVILRDSLRGQKVLYLSRALFSLPFSIFFLFCVYLVVCPSTFEINHFLKTKELLDLQRYIKKIVENRIKSVFRGSHCSATD